MPECELCGETVDKVYKCKICGTKYCDICGLPEDRICINCLDEEDYYDEYEENPFRKCIDEKPIPRHLKSVISIYDSRIDSFLGWEFP
jgi:hypothetical protein